ncbi:hypothetical protein [Pseudoteredinibacter isoporae]|uniref:Uncharacterized protein n=1 Tax=Pseudoteredinibacter isoporae TaxID=570281 RepID=A0A7X0JX64_9GAMM|nr:hypothetical protein [Pseudoteredinibacter isoporae]MBB6523852.1 hypothetical protein [Pseudoteredinibacter isoporae]NHO89369.1 hypothetical protein [Pseudoteredinibacter isoporae]NIB22476.1 hypothetical protein [Pseudoteredinibacter isoporae]
MDVKESSQQSKAQVSKEAAGKSIDLSREDLALLIEESKPRTFKYETILSSLVVIFSLLFLWVVTTQAEKKVEMVEASIQELEGVVEAVAELSTEQADLIARSKDDIRSQQRSLEELRALSQQELTRLRAMADADVEDLRDLFNRMGRVEERLAALGANTVQEPASE